MFNMELAGLAAFEAMASGLVAELGTMASLWPAVGEAFYAAEDELFSQGGNPSWPDKKDTTVAWEAAHGGGGGPMVFLGDLQTSFTSMSADSIYRPSPLMLEVGTHLGYAYVWKNKKSARNTIVAIDDSAFASKVDAAMVGYGQTLGTIWEG